MVKTNNLPEREAWVFRRLQIFYGDKCNLDRLAEIINNSSKKKLSLRLIDWFVTNYSKKFNIVYPIERPGGDVELFAPYQRYRDQLSAYPKKLFDPFCRGAGLLINYENLEIVSEEEAKENKLKVYETAICQLHFFKWAIENLVTEYIEQNIEAIYDDMQSNCSRVNVNPIKKAKQKLSNSVYSKMVENHVPVKLSFYK